MTKTVAVSPELVKHLEMLQRKQGERVSTVEITAIVEGILASLAGDLSPTDLKLYTELEGLARFIQGAKAEIASVRPHEINAQDIPLATDELDAVVGATEEATGTILDACEALERLGTQMTPDVAQEVSAVVTRIYEACNFQDITGQRINKVVKTLKHIEGRVATLLDAFGDGNVGQHGRPAGGAGGSGGDAGLLNGPQLPDDAKRQAEIDAILASFDR